MKLSIHVFISGVVQGVCFRDWTKKMADKKGLFGWVKNIPSGEVEAVFEGEEKEIQKALEELKKGPSGALVEHISIREKKEIQSPHFQSFSIRFS